MVPRPAADVYRFGEDVPASVSFFHPAWRFKLLYPPLLRTPPNPTQRFTCFLGCSLPCASICTASAIWVLDGQAAAVCTKRQVFAEGGYGQERVKAD